MEHTTYEVNDVTQNQKPKQSREEKAAQMFRTGVIARKTQDGWEVPGSNGTTYEVREDFDQWTCSCPDYTFRGHTGPLCKHILFIMLLRNVAPVIDHDIHLKAVQVV